MNILSLSRNLQWKLGIESPSLKYANETASKEILFAVPIPYKLLKVWHDLSLRHTELSQDNNSTSTINTYHFVDLLECSIPVHSFAITQDETVQAKVNKSLRQLASCVKNKLKRTNSRKQKEMESGTKLLHASDGHTVSLDNLKSENKVIYDQLNEWKKT